ncbi:hypothetical protein OUZ56_026100 [Daphnia magna]|uniref:Uncharacterized protein n=1 Tax=Daphnia magna TaxID=35525 RepID=A0ABQ9ZKU2_9CRUS|nr:hypothetical protein OUZ56_026100 [Daphnia magna]
MLICQEQVAQAILDIFCDVREGCFENIGRKVAWLVGAGCHASTWFKGHMSQCSVAWEDDDLRVYSEPGDSRESLRKQQVGSGDSLKPLFPLSIKHADNAGFTKPLVLDENVNYYGSLADQGPVTDVKEVYGYLP